MTDSSDSDGLPFEGSYDHLGSAPSDDEERLTIRDTPDPAVVMEVAADTTEARRAIEDLSASLERLAVAAREVDEAMGRIEARDLTISIDIDSDTE